MPDLRLVPTELLARAYGRALRRRSLPGYGDPNGDCRLRAALADLLLGVRGLGFHPGRQFAFDDRPLPNLRLGFFTLDEEELQEAVRRMKRAL